jgi:hypothetical protein
MKVRLEEHLKNRPEYARIRLRAMQDNTREQRASGRTRSKTEEDILLKLDSLRWKRWVVEGKIEITGEREFRVRL